VEGRWVTSIGGGARGERRSGTSILRRYEGREEVRDLDLGWRQGREEVGDLDLGWRQGRGEVRDLDVRWRQGVEAVGDPEEEAAPAGRRDGARRRE